MYLVSIWSFQHGFLDYVNRSELSRLEGLSIALSSEYEKQGSWRNLQKDPSRWENMINTYVLNITQLNESTLLRSKHSDPFENTSLTRPGKIILLNSEQTPIMGAKHVENQAIYKPIMSNNRIIGYLGIEKRLELTRDLDQVFSKQQQGNFIWIAFGAIIIAIGIALPFSSRLIKPIQDLLRSTQAISRGDYHQRVRANNNDEIGQLSSAFNSMADSLEKHQAIQEQWLADISHELRTPLAIIKAETEALLDGVRELNLDNIQSIHQELNYINHLVQDLHSLSQSDVNALRNQRELHSLSCLVNEVINIFEQEINDKGLHLIVESEGDSKAYIDKDRITQVLMNLMQNNLRYCNQGAQLKIHLHTDKNTGELILIWEDSGPGVNNNNIGRLFDRLYREDSSRSRFDAGSGLGLSISKQIIENHHGRIEAFHSTLGGLGIKLFLPHAKKP